MTSINVDDLGRVLLAEYDYKYKANDGRVITIDVGQEFILIKKSNADWWQVIKPDEKKPFYIPAAYMKEIDQRRFPDHQYFKKAHATLQKSKKKQRLLEEKLKQETGHEKTVQPLQQGKERMIVVTGSREDLTVLSSHDDKFSEMRASTDSLDRFIENENPYDEVPFESTFSPRVRNISPPQFEKPEYENLEVIQKTIDPSFHQSKDSSTVNQPVDVVHESPARRSTNENIHPQFPSGQSPASVTTVEVFEDGWELQMDNQTGGKYYYNSISGEMSVKSPHHVSSPTASHRGNKTSFTNKVIPPALPDASKKPSLERSQLSPKFDEEKPRLIRRQTSPARYRSNPSSPVASELYQPMQDVSMHDPWSPNKLQDDLQNKSNNNNKSSKPHEGKHTKTNSDSSMHSQSSTTIPSPKYFSPNTSDEDVQSSPNGWMRERSTEGDVVFINEMNGERWYQLTDEQTGKFYYFNDLTRQTSWQLPQFDLHVVGDNLINESHGSDDNDHSVLTKTLSDDGFKHQRKANTLERDNRLHVSSMNDFNPTSTSSLPHNVNPSLVISDAKVNQRSGRAFTRQAKRVMHARSMILLNDVQPTTPPLEETHQSENNLKSSYSECNLLSNSRGKSRFSQEGEITSIPPPHPMIERQGRLHWTKLIEAGKKQRKNWLQQWVVLLANNLLFYKDQKQASMSKTLPHGRPDSSCDLRGANVGWAKDKSSKKNVIELQTIRGLSLLLQHDDLTTIHKWLTAIKATIERANQVDPLDPDIFPQKPFLDDDEEEVDSKKKKDKKKKSKPPLRHGSDAKNSDKVRSKLKKFINRRPTFESLQERGIIKETVFGCPLEKLCEKERSTVPSFVQLCVKEVEKRGLDVDGIYRVSGNLSHVQKLRYLIDRDEPVNLSESQWEDIHLITGALKMFLRELPEPVIPFKFFDKFITACKIQDEKQRIHAMKNLVKVLPKTNGDTLKYLMQHFCRVVEHSSKNRMQVQNIAIVFGPTLLLKPPDETTSRTDAMTSGHMAVYMVYQNQIIDYMLTEYESVFG